MPISRSLRFWRSLPLRAQMFAGMLIPLLVLTLSAALVYALLRPAHEELAKGHRNIRAVALYSEIYSAALAAQTGQRGFAITGQESFLGPYFDSRRDFGAALTELRQIEADHPARLAALLQIERSFEEFLGSVADPVIALRMRSPQRIFAAGFDTVVALDTLLSQLARGDATEADIERYGERYAAARELASNAPLGVGWQRTEATHRHFIEQLAAADATTRDALLRNGEALRSELTALTSAAGRIENGAADIVASGHGLELLEQIRDAINTASAEHSVSHATATAKGQQRARTATWLAVILPIGAGLLGLGAMVAMQSDQVRAIRKLRGAASAVALDEPETLLALDRTDELGELSRSFVDMAGELAARRRQMHNLDEFQSMLLSSSSAEEAYAVTERASSELLPGLQGGLYLIAASGNMAELVAHWPGAATPLMAVFEPNACRALRTGRDHYATCDSVAPFCSHSPQPHTASLCIPLTSRGDAFGILVLTPLGSATTITPQERTLANTIATRLALVLANLRLADTLRAQSIRDPLTGCFNRRYLEETLEREVARVRRAQGSLALLAVDADHFKRFNDQFGHDAGDLVLKELAQVLRRGVRTADIVCRYGGEEFVVVIPDADREAGLRIAEELRRTVAQLSPSLRGNKLGNVTISVGVAFYPDHGATGEQLIQQADAALYRAKHGGRDRVELARDSDAPQDD